MTIEHFDFKELMEKEAVKKPDVPEKEPEKRNAPIDRRKFIKLFGLGVLAAAMGVRGDLEEREKSVSQQKKETLSEPVKKTSASTTKREIDIADQNFPLEEGGTCEAPRTSTGTASPVQNEVVRDIPKKADEEPLRELSFEEALKEIERNPERFLQQHGFMSEYFNKNTPEECEAFYGYVITKARGFYEGHDKRMNLIGRAFQKVAKCAPIIFEAAEKHQVPYGVALGIAILESKCDPNLVSRAGAKGIMQLMPETARTYGLKVEKLVDERENPRKNIQAGIRHLRDLYSYFGRWDLAALAYNTGQGSFRKSLKKEFGKGPEDRVTNEEVRASGINCARIYQRGISKNYYSASAEAHLRMYLWYLQESRAGEVAENERKFRNPAE